MDFGEEDDYYLDWVLWNNGEPSIYLTQSIIDGLVKDPDLHMMQVYFQEHMFFVGKLVRRNNTIDYAMIAHLHLPKFIREAVDGWAMDEVYTSMDIQTYLTKLFGRES